MAKKQKRQAATAARPQYSEPVQTVNTGTTTVSQQPGSLRSRPGEFNPDYTYVIRDLKRIGVLAGSFIALLIVLSFFLR